MSRLRIGIIGCGGIANGKHLPSLKALNRADIVAFCDLIPERAEKAAKEYGTPDAKVYTDYHELLKDESIDVCYVLTPNRSHADISIDALHAGKHVMCEKPMAKTAADARRMVAVSYTHLDVYKRQVHRFSGLQSQERYPGYDPCLQGTDSLCACAQRDSSGSRQV